MAKVGAKAPQKTTLTNEKLTIRQFFEFSRMEAAKKREKGHDLGEDLFYRLNSSVEI